MSVTSTPRGLRSVQCTRVTGRQLHLARVYVLRLPCMDAWTVYTLGVPTHVHVSQRVQDTLRSCWARRAKLTNRRSTQPSGALSYLFVG